jgi:hypothetical protein
MRQLWIERKQTISRTTYGAFPPSHFSNKLADKLAQKVASQTNVTHFCLVLSVRSLLQTKLVCYKLTMATLRASLSSSLLQKCDGGNAP